MANWEKKSSYLLREIVKFRTYIDCLQAAEAQKKKVYAEREVEKAVKGAGDDEDDGDTTLQPEWFKSVRWAHWPKVNDVDDNINMDELRILELCT